jgi:hypothetical protein
MPCTGACLLLCQQKLQHAHQVLQLKLETDARTHKQALAAAARERQQLEQQLEQLHLQLEAKDKEARASALAAKQAQRKLEEVKGSAAKAVAGVNARVAEAVAAEAARHKQMEDARVHLMLCVIHDPDSSSSSRGEVQEQQPQQLQVSIVRQCCVEPTALAYHCAVIAGKHLASATAAHRPAVAVATQKFLEGYTAPCSENNEHMHRCILT